MFTRRSAISPAVRPRILAFRPASVVERLDPHSHACLLSTRELIGPARGLGGVLPIVTCPLGAVARGVLVAAKELQSALGLALPPGTSVERWFEGVSVAADEVAAGTPLFLCAEVHVAGEGAAQVERAFHEAWRLVGAGITHLAVDVAAVPGPERARVVSEVAEAGVEHGICVEVVLPLFEGAEGGARIAELFAELARRGTPADLAGLRCRAPVGEHEGRLQAVALARIGHALGGVPLVRRGPAAGGVLDTLRGSPVKMCEDGGVVSARAVGLVPLALLQAEAEAPARASALERAVAELSEDGLERIEARAYVDALEFLERLGARGSAAALTRSLLRRLEEG
jgi:hypothetical protein